MTSGSTGDPYYFPRQSTQGAVYVSMAELYLRANFRIHERRTLYVVAFPMGAWIGGVFTYEALTILSQRRQYDLSVITPGIDKRAVVNAVKRLSPYFDQVIIGAYAPFLKDILDDGVRHGVDWHGLRLGFVLSAEAFSEQFRDYLARTAALDNVLLDTLNHYGTVDMGTMAHEIPLSILTRRTIFESPATVCRVFPEEHQQPTLAQYIPELFHFEEDDATLICSSWSGLPLVRYDLKDYGGVVTKADLEQRLESQGRSLPDLVDSSGIGETVWNLPFVYVYERKGFSVSYYAFLVYPDSVRRALSAQRFVHALTGKFTMTVDYTKDGQQRLVVNAEVKHDVKTDTELARDTQLAIHQQLMIENSEYRELYSLKADVVIPAVELWPYESPEYFKPGIKQKWVT